MDRRDVIGLLLTLSAMGAEEMAHLLENVFEKKTEEGSQGQGEENKKVVVQVEIRD
jgi:hypothetical protein